MPEDIQKQRILIVDDTIDNIRILVQTLRSDYKILSALNGQEGIDSATANQPDLILLDILMPGMDGYEACRRLKTDERTRDIPVIFITAKTGEEHELTGFDVGGVDYITKPFSPVVVKARVKLHLSLRLANQELESKNIALAARIADLENARNEIKAIKSLVPICSYCKKIRDDKDYWDQLEVYLQKYSGIDFSHGICPDCYEKHVKPQMLRYQEKEKR